MTRKMISVGLSLLCTGCRRPGYTVPETPMPPNTVLLSQMMRELSAQPGFTEAVLRELGDSGEAAKHKKGPAMMTPELVDELRQRILGKDWQGLDRFPGWTMRRINPTVRVVGHLAGKDAKLEAASEAHPGAAARAEARQYLDLGPYALDDAAMVTLERPATGAGFENEDKVSPLGDGVTRGDGPNQLAFEHAASQRLADALNRLAANKLEGAERFRVTMHAKGGEAATPEELVALLQRAGHTVTVQDARYFANFAHLHYRRGNAGASLDVMAPFWIDSQLIVPRSGGRHLLVPVSHAELEWHVRGPKVNADVSYYFGIDGKAQWRTMDTLDQAWVLERNAHTYTGAQAVEATRLAGLLTLALMHQHEARPRLPFGGYYALGVCQDGVSAIELRLTGKVTLFPNTADHSLFTDARDAEINGLLKAVPNDREGAAPGPERIFGSLPVAPVEDRSPVPALHAFDAVTIPGLAADLNATYAAWQAGELSSTRRLASPRNLVALLALVSAACLVFAVTRKAGAGSRDKG